ncbi:MAG: DHHA1 domain-containing protein [Methanomicrobiales archaeon]|nr:DHHA1 domain-containing protein [Methanomicrobiales archaeon]
MMDLPVYIRWEDRDKAEQKFGFDLYQGGVPPGKEIRVVQVDGEVQACAGTHCHSTGEVGAIKVIRVEHIQDGVERIEFAAGIAALYQMQRIERLLSDASGVLSVQPDNLPSSATRFFTEWKERGKEIERLRERLAELEAKTAEPETIQGIPVLVRRIDLAPKDLVALAARIAERGGIAVLAGGNGPVHVAGASGRDGVSATDLVAKACAVLGGKGGGNPKRAQGGGPNAGAVNEALALAMEEIRKVLHA